MQVRTCWKLQHIDVLTAVADDMEEKLMDGQALDVYERTHVPGQPWGAYRSKSIKEKDDDKYLNGKT